MKTVVMRSGGIIQSVGKKAGEVAGYVSGTVSNLGITETDLRTAALEVATAVTAAAIIENSKGFLQ